MFQFLLVCFVLLTRRSSDGSLCATKVIVRVPRDKDIGLIFDMTVTNRIRSDKRETLDFTVVSNGECTVNTTHGEQVHAMGRIFGGDFGSVEPGKSETVSLVWPTVSLYNRVGSCPILISATSAHATDAVATARQVLHFDTRFDTLDPHSNKLRRRKDYKNCGNWDKNYLRNCTPVNCEERYFGKRSYFNVETEQCEPASDCSGPGEYYDIFSNEGVDPGNFVSEEELDQIKQGNYDSNFLDLRGPPPLHEPKANKARQYKKKSRRLADPTRHFFHSKPTKSDDCDNSRKLTLADFNDCFQHLKDGQSQSQSQSQFVESVNEKIIKKKSPFEVPMLTQLYYDWYLPLRTDSWGEGGEIGGIGDPSPQNVSSGSEPLIMWIGKLDWRGWVFLILKGSFFIFATLTAYFLVCLFVYGFMELYSFWTSDEAPETFMMDSSSQSTAFNLVTSESLMSHR
uniref:GG17000 n=1 Tax=Drosophila erecta TaxID=7220 RepID=B3P119_DROER